MKYLNDANRGSLEHDLQTITGMCRRDDDSNGNHDDVERPWRGSDSGYKLAASVILPGCSENARRA